MNDEARLIAAAARGDRDAFETLVRGRQEKVFWTAYQVVGHSEDARDVAQQVFIRLWQVLPRYRPRQSFEAWLYRITVNLAIDACRRRGARPELADGGEAGAAAPATEPDPAGAADRRELQRIFNRLARRLSPQQRAVFVLSEMNGLDSSEIARVMEISASTVRNHLHQARRILRRALAAEYPEYLPPAERQRSGGPEGDAS